jgi:hypothetical protein
MKVVTIADELFRELGEPSTVSIPSIAFWLRSNVGGLNNLIGTAYRILDGGEEINLEDGDTRTLLNTLEISQLLEDSSGSKIEVEIGGDEKAIYKKMYTIHYYERLLRNNLTSLATDSVISVSDDGSSVTKVNKNEITKVYNAIKNQEVNELKFMTQGYKLLKATPRQVAGNDTVEGSYPNYGLDSYSRNDMI